MRHGYRLVIMIMLVLACLRAWAEKPSKRASHDEKPAKKNGETRVPPPCSCVRDMLQDRPNPYPDVYSCIDYFDISSPCTDPEDDIWVGFPVHTPPQHCEADVECEACIEWIGEKKKTRQEGHDLSTYPPIEGHQEYLTEANAFGEFCAQLKSAQDYYQSKVTLRPGGPRYYILRKSDWKGLADDVSVMVVPLDIPDPLSPNMKPLYFGIQLDKAPDAIDWPGAKKVTVGTGKLVVKCEVSSQSYTSFVWLKKGKEADNHR